jgi:hypothetical protein
MPVRMIKLVGTNAAIRKGKGTGFPVSNRRFSPGPAPSKSELAWVDARVDDCSPSLKISPKRRAGKLTLFGFPDFLRVIVEIRTFALSVIHQQPLSILQLRSRREQGQRARHFDEVPQPAIVRSLVPTRLAHIQLLDRHGRASRRWRLKINKRFCLLGVTRLRPLISMQCNSILKKL